MVCDDFVNQDVLGVPDEHFLKYLDKGLDPKDMLLKVLEDGRDSTGNFAVKVMANYIGQVNFKLSKDHDLAGPFANFYAAFKGANWVYIQRLEKDRQAISRVKARASGIYHLRRRENKLRLGNTVADDRLALERSTAQYTPELGAEIAKEIQNIQREEATWKDFFEHWDIKPFTITYERAAQGGKNYLIELARAAGLTVSDHLPLRSIKKLSNSNSDILVQQFRAEYGQNYVSQ